MTCDESPLLPSYTLAPPPPFLPYLSDVSLSLLLPLVVYWTFSSIFQIIETSGLGSRLQPFNTPTEMLVRNRVSKTYAFFYIMMNFTIQGTIAWGLSKLEGEVLIGKEEYDITVWALRLHSAQRWIPRFLAIVGIDSVKLAASLTSSAPAIATIFTGGVLHKSIETDQSTSCSHIPTSFDRSLAEFVYYYSIPALQFFVAFSVTDVWQYFGHRALHEWKWLYRHVHSVHHQLYVPWAWSAFYMHPVESILLDGVSVAIAFPTARLTTRQGMWFTTIVTFKAICDHAGYEIPCNPVYSFPYANDVHFHNLHHQSWGLKHNFGIYSLFWDWALGTLWTDKDAANHKYAKYRRMAEDQYVCKGMGAAGTDTSIERKTIELGEPTE